MAKEACGKQIEEHKLDVHLVSVRYNFDRSLLTVCFTADERVDFRDMVKALGTELGTRVEMRQIGVRDAAGLTGGVGPCGRLLCCCSWVKRFEGVNVKMAKAQRLSLNPTAISGMCSRLKCCLRFEHDCYREYARHLPREGTQVECHQGRGRVIDRDILGQRLRVRLEDDRVVSVGAGDARVVAGAPGGKDKGERQ
jgi:cell fate regulator YaaT (PSP1 superfamily)